jgi:hypothetical protein
MKPFCAVLMFCIFISFAGFSNPPRDIFKHDQRADQDAKMFSGGIFQADFKALNSSIGQYGNSRGFSPFFVAAGMDFIVPCGGRYGEHNASLCAEFIFPQTIAAGDSIQFRILGWHIITNLWGYDFLKQNNKYALEFGPGVDWGSLYMKVNSGAETERFKNPFIAPLVRLEYRVVIKPFAFGIRGTYRYDISSPRWKDNTDYHSVLAHSRISGFACQVFFGWGRTIKDDSKYYKK